MKKTKVIIPALGILLLSTAASVTGTVAWFSMNSEVTADGMLVQAKAEQGIVIANADHTDYAAVASAKKDDVYELLPASTSDFTTWWHAKSDNPTTGVAIENTYTSTGVAEETHWISHDFYIRASTPTALTVASLNVAEVSASSTQNLSKALRVGIKFNVGTDKPIYAPVSGATLSYRVHGDSANTVALESTDVYETGITSIPGHEEGVGIKATVYIWFEGEDENCVSDNVVSNLDEVEITVKFSYTE